MLSSKLTVGVQVLTLLTTTPKRAQPSEYIASNVNTNSWAFSTRSASNETLKSSFLAISSRGGRVSESGRSQGGSVETANIR
jgi:hypothetical protein